VPSIKENYRHRPIKNRWKEEEAGSKISTDRLEEAIEAGPHVLAVACPFCFLMLQEAIQF